RNDGSGGFTSVDAADASSPFRDLMVTDHFHNAETTYVADFDNDGDLDIWDYAGNDHMLNAGPGVNGPGIYLRNDGGRYVRLADDDNPMKDMVSEQDLVIHGDFDGDGDEDLLAYKEGGLALGYYRNNGAGIFTEVAYENSPFGNIAAADQFFSAINTHVADFDGDGDLDIWDTTNGQAPVYLQNSGGTYVRLSGTDNPLQDVAWMIGYANGIVGDFDSDGDVDVLAYHSDGLTPEFLQNNGSGQFTVIAQADSPFAGIDQPYWNLPETYVADFDNDGDVDIWDYRGDGDSIYTQQLGAPPKLSDSNPLDDSTGVPADAPLVLHFNEIIAAVGSGAIRIHRSSDDALMQTIAAASTSVTGVGTQTITITPATPLVGLTGYYLLIDNQAFRDAQGMVFAGIADKTRLNFTTDTFNAAPVVNAPLPDSSATAGSAFNFQFAANAFVDIDVGDTLNYTAELTAGGALPAWLIFNPATRTFSGTPAAGDIGTLSIDVTADDGHGGTVTDTFNLVITRPAPPVTPTDPVPVPVDGVPVTTTPGDGGTTIITIPVVTPTRPDDPNSPNSALAD
ncbi:MAG: FG-GAP-like repeat-containing protein, partial [Janthinobacterium sp.]